MGRADGALEGRLNGHALAAATLAVVPRVPFMLRGRRVGSVAHAHLPALAGFAELAVSGGGVALNVPPDERDGVFDRINAALRARGLITAWRDETYPVPDADTGETLARFERASSRFWGTLTFGAHANGYVAGPDGRPVALWIAQRSLTKATDPGLYDNLIGGGVPAGQTPAETLVREGFEEAGLLPDQLSGAVPASVLRLHRDIPEGLQHEWLHAFDLPLPEGTVPINQDGEVAGFTRMPVAEALALARDQAMTVDAALVTLDFGLRHGLLQDAAALKCIRALRVVRMW